MQEHAFQAAKNALQSEAVLIHYDPSLPMVLACDASPHCKNIFVALTNFVESANIYYNILLVKLSKIC